MPYLTPLRKNLTMLSRHGQGRSWELIHGGIARFVAMKLAGFLMVILGLSVLLPSGAHVCSLCRRMIGIMVSFCSSSLDVGWASKSFDLLSQWNVPDWPDVQNCHSYASYKGHVDKVLQSQCASKWLVSAASHKAQVPYTLFQSKPQNILHEIRALNLPWDLQFCVRSWCRLRAGLLCLRARNGHPSSARSQSCIFCGDGVRYATVHAIGGCRCWVTQRTAFIAAAHFPSPRSAHELCLEVPGCCSNGSGFKEVLKLSGAIDRGSEEFWRERGR